MRIALSTLLLVLFGLAGQANPLSQIPVQGLLFSNAEKGIEDHLLVPKLETHHMDMDDWNLLASGIHQRQEESPYGIQVLIVGDTVKHAYQNAFKVIHTLEKNHVEYEIIYVPTEYAMFFQDHSAEVLEEVAKAGYPGQNSLRWRHIFRAADANDWFIGSLLGVTSAGVNAWLWFYQNPIEPHIAWALVSASALPAFFHSMKLKFFDRLYKFKVLGKKIGHKVSTLTEMGKRNISNWFYAEIFRFYSGPVGGAAPALSIQGQAEVIAHVAAFGIGSSYFSAVRNKVFSHNEDASRWVNFYNYMIIAPFVFLDIGGQYNLTWDIQHTTLGALAASFALTQAGKLKWVKEKLFKNSDKALKKFSLYNYLFMAGLAVSDASGLISYPWESGAIHVHDTTLTVLGMNVLLSQVIKLKHVQQKLEGFVDKKEKSLQKLRNWIKGAFATCNSLLTK